MVVLESTNGQSKSVHCSINVGPVGVGVGKDGVTVNFNGVYVDPHGYQSHQMALASNLNVVVVDNDGLVLMASRRILVYVQFGITCQFPETDGVSNGQVQLLIQRY